MGNLYNDSSAPGRSQHFYEEQHKNRDSDHGRVIRGGFQGRNSQLSGVSLNKFLFILAAAEVYLVELEL